MQAAPDFEQASRDVLRAIRGKRSQVGFSRLLGFRSNVAANWESGRRMPTAAESLRYTRRAGRDVADVLRRFHSPTAQLASELTGQAIGRWLDALRGGQTLSSIARRSRLSRFSVGRFLGGRSEPRLPQFLSLVDALTDRAPDFVHEWVDIENVPALKSRYARTRAARDAMFEHPLCLAVLCLLDTRTMDRPVTHQIQGLARTLGRPRETIESSLRILESAGIICRRKGRFRPTGSLTIETKSDPERELALRAYWTRLAAQRARASEPTDVCSYSVFSVSEKDYAKLQQMQREFYRAARGLVASSTPTELAGLLVVHSLSWRPGDR